MAASTTLTVIPTTQDWTDYDAAQARLTAAFDLVCDPADWRAPINAVVPAGTSLPLLAEAIIHFTATVPVFTRCGATFRVKAVGYRNGPAGC